MGCRRSSSDGVKRLWPLLSFSYTDDGCRDGKPALPLALPLLYHTVGRVLVSLGGA